MIVAILVALLVTVIVYGLTRMACDKVIAAEYQWIAWLVAIVLIVVAWWRLVLGELIGPLP
jgi:hypothetical protein